MAGHILARTIVITTGSQEQHAKLIVCSKPACIRTQLCNIYIIIGASLSEPHIDHDNVPRRRECLYKCMWPRVAFVASIVPENMLVYYHRLGTNADKK